MSGYRRHLMAEIANRSFIEGYCNVYNSTFTFQLYLNGPNAGNKQQITVNTDTNGYWRYKLGQNKLYRLQEAFTSVSQAESDKLLSVRFNCDMSNLDSIYCMCYNTNSVHAENLTSIIGIKFSESTYLNGYRYGFRETQVSQISLEGWKNSNAQNAQGMFNTCRSLTTIKTDATTSMKISNANVMFRYCNSLENLDLSFSWVEFSQGANLSYAFGETYSLKSNPQDGIFDLSRFSFYGSLSNMFFTFSAEKTTWESQTGKTAWEYFTHIALPTLLDGCDVTDAFIYLTQLEEITACGNIGAITGALSFVNSPLSLNSAKLVLSKLQDLNGNSATITFSSATLALVQASINNGDVDTISAVTNAIDNGWIITGLDVIY